MDTPNVNLLTRQRAIQALAVVGFVALVGAGIWLAVYSTRFVPSVVNRIGTAAVYLGSIFTPAEEPALSVIPTASTTIPFGTANSTITASVTEPKATSTSAIIPKKDSTAFGPKKSTTYQMTGSTVLYGLPDFVVTIDAVGYLTSTSTDSFVASSTVPFGNLVAIKFTVTNIGTNTTGSWRVHAVALTQIFDSPFLESISPGSSAPGILYIDKATHGTNQMISITANFDHAVTESNTDNNSDSAQITILGN